MRWALGPNSLKNKLSKRRRAQSGRKKERERERILEQGVGKTHTVMAQLRNAVYGSLPDALLDVKAVLLISIVLLAPVVLLNEALSLLVVRRRSA